MKDKKEINTKKTKTNNPEKWREALKDEKFVKAIKAMKIKNPKKSI